MNEWKMIAERSQILVILKFIQPRVDLSSPFASCLFIFGSSILIKQVLGLKFEQQLSGQLITEH